MQLPEHPFSIANWAEIDAVAHPGVSGEAIWRTQEVGNVRVRMVEYTPGYVADHWCQRGHILLVIDGVLHTELDDGRQLTLSAGQSYHVSDGMEAHRSSTTTGARLFIVD